MTRDAWLNAADLIPTACRRCTIIFAHCTEIILYMCAFVWTLTLYTEIFVTLLNGFHRQVYSVVLGFQWRDCIWATKKRVHAPPCHAPSPCRPSMPCPIPTTQLEMFAARGIISLVSCLGRYCPGSERIHFGV